MTVLDGQPGQHGIGPLGTVENEPAVGRLSAALTVDHGCGDDLRILGIAAANGNCPSGKPEVAIAVVRIEANRDDDLVPVLRRLDTGLDGPFRTAGAAIPHFATAVPCIVSRGGIHVNRVGMHLSQTDESEDQGDRETPATGDMHAEPSDRGSITSGSIASLPFHAFVGQVENGSRGSRVRRFAGTRL